MDVGYGPRKSSQSELQRAFIHVDHQRLIRSEDNVIHPAIETHRLRKHRFGTHANRTPERKNKNDPQNRGS